MSTRAGHCKKDKCDVYVGRPTKFGNPYAFPGTDSKVSGVTEVTDPIAAYEAHVRADADLMAALPELRGKTLGCWCVRVDDPQPPAGEERCHAEVLVRLVEEMPVRVLLEEHIVGFGPTERIAVETSVPTDLNPGIRRTVAALNAAGFETMDSGDGETHEHPCDRDHGYVVIILDDRTRLVDEADRVRAVLRKHGVMVVPQDIGRPEVGCCYVQGSYCPADRLALIDVSHVHDRMLLPSPDLGAFPNAADAFDEADSAAYLAYCESDDDISIADAFAAACPRAFAAWRAGAT